MTSMPSITKESAKPHLASPVYVEGNTPSNGEEEVEKVQETMSPPNIVMGIESMQVDSTHITVDAKEDAFSQYGTNIIGNITAYSSSNEEDEEEERKKEEEEEKFRRIGKEET